MAAGAAAVCLAGLRLPGLPVADRARAYVSKPPPAHTGGFGEPTCHRCHFGRDLNETDGKLQVEGLPAAYAPEATYELVVSLQKEEMRRGGFQLSVRGPRGEQAGELTAPDDRVEVVSERGVSYATQTESGAAIAQPGTARWNVSWRAPGTATHPVLLHVAANAANDDDSELGDFIFSREISVPPDSGAASAGSPSASELR